MATKTTSEWTGLRGKIGAWFFDNPLRKRRESSFLDRILTHIQGHEVVLDVGSGSGYFSVPVARKLVSGKVICLDLSTEMLQRLQKKAEREGLKDRIQILQTDAASPGLENESVDLMISNVVFHELADPEAVLAKVYSILRDDGKVLIKDFSRDTFRGKIIARFHHGDSHGPFTREGLKRLLEKTGLTKVEVILEKGCLVGVGTKQIGKQ